ncbi:hypothetical protein P0845_004295 [Salmonella enterica]|nr:hypothetical protein [Salmonella enterica]
MVIRKGFYADGHFDSKVDGEYVKYDDYAELRSLLFRMTDSVNLSELPEGLYDDLEKAGLL